MAAAPFRLTTLGRLALADAAGGEDPSLATRRRKLAVLVVLAVSRKPITRDALTELFWGDQAEERARHSLSDTLSHLRRVLGPDSIAARRADIALAKETPLTVDIAELHAAAQAQQWGAVTALYAGPFLDGVHVPDSPRFDQWVTTQRATVERLFETACRHECARLAEAGAWQDCAALASRWLDRAPLSVEAADRLFTALELEAADPVSGARQALAAYDRLARRLQLEFETTPHASLVARADAWRARRSAASVPLSLPAPSIAAPEPMPPSPAPVRTARRWLAIAGLGIAAVGVASALPRGNTTIISVGGTPRPITTRSAEALALYRASFSDPDLLRGEAPDAEARLERAVAIDPSFAMAWQRIGSILDGDENARTRVHEALSRARALSDSVSAYERHLILGTYHMIVSGNLAEAAAEFRATLEIEPGNVSNWHRLGMVYQYLGDDERAAAAYSAANRIAPTSAARWINLVDVRFASGDTAGAARAIDSMALHLPGHASVYVMAANLSAATGDLDRALSMVRSYATSGPGNERTQAFARMYRSRIHWTAGRLDAGDADSRDAMQRNLARGDSVWALRDGLALVQATAWLRHEPSVARAQLSEVLAKVPVDSLRPLDRPWLEIALAAAVAGDPSRARAALAAYDRDATPYVRDREESRRHHAEGTLALTEGRFSEAVRHLEQAAFPECRVCGLPELALAHEALGDSDTALRTYREYLETPTLRRTDLLDALHLRWVRARLEARAPAWRPHAR